VLPDEPDDECVGQNGAGECAEVEFAGCCVDYSQPVYLVYTSLAGACAPGECELSFFGINGSVQALEEFACSDDYSNVYIYGTGQGGGTVTSNRVDPCP
jgi:hypothetical protein